MKLAGNSSNLKEALYCIYTIEVPPVEGFYIRNFDNALVTIPTPVPRYRGGNMYIFVRIRTDGEAYLTSHENT